MRSGLNHAARTPQPPAFALVAVGALALSIGANTVIFSLTHALLLPPVPLPHASRIVMPISVNVRGVRDGGILDDAIRCAMKTAS